jgi:adenosylcobinamide-GDP ribazoletransferase
MRALAEALRFLSVIPVPGTPPEKTSRVPAFYPWAGLLLGIPAAGDAGAAGCVFSAAGAAVTVVALRIAVTGGLHMDGLADLADGTGGGRDREKRLAIMADSRLGTFGALALLVMTALQITVIAELLQLPFPEHSLKALFPLLFAPAFSRGIIPLMMRIFPSARPGGMGDRNRRTALPSAVIAALVSVIFIGTFFFGIAGLAVSAVVLLLLLSAGARISRQLGGLTGDVYGALIETGDLLILFGLFLVFHFNLSTPGLLSLLR